MSAVQTPILNALKSPDIFQDRYNHFYSSYYICSNDKRFLYELCSYDSTITTNDTYTGKFITSNAKSRFGSDWWPTYYMDNEHRIFCFNRRQRVYYKTVLTIESTFTSVTVQHKSLRPTEWGAFPVRFLATDKPNCFVVLKVKGNPVEENHFFWFDALTEDVRPIGLHVNPHRGAFYLGSNHQVYKGKVYASISDYGANKVIGLCAVDLTPEIIPLDPNELPLLEWKILDIKEIKPVNYIFSTFLVESDYLYAIWQQQPVVPVDCSLLIVYDLLADEYMTCLLKSTFVSRPVAMALDGGVLTVYKKKKSKSNGQQITTFHYTLRKPETLTMLALICSQKLNAIDPSVFPIRPPFSAQKRRSKRSASVGF
ncbi:hypothetical protein M3Y96_00899600 [Aphelenchoides besseyi]|nr:hypothetical protein M3Y96_00899600 [Aphelenchoides besseyi]